MTVRGPVQNVCEVDLNDEAEEDNDLVEPTPAQSPSRTSKTPPNAKKSAKADVTAKIIQQILQSLPDMKIHHATNKA